MVMEITKMVQVRTKNKRLEIHIADNGNGFRAITTRYVYDPDVCLRNRLFVMDTGWISKSTLMTMAFLADTFDNSHRSATLEGSDLAVKGKGLRVAPQQVLDDANSNLPLLAINCK